jgi:hypothetical protein
MKTANFYKLILLMFAVAFTVSCVQDDEFETPDTTVGEEPFLNGPEITIGAVAGISAQEDGDNFTFDETDQYMVGYVNSSDEFGNFFEELILQDSPENPTVGIRVLIDVNPLFTRYEVGRKVYVNTKGLTLGISNGVLSLGVAGDSFIEKIPAALELSTILRSPEVATLVPLTLDLDELPEDEDAFDFTNLYVTINNVQFNRNSVLIDEPLTYAAEPFDQFDGERILENCAGSTDIVLSTSTFADFAPLQLPAGSGSVTGVLTKNFFGDEYNIVINKIEDVMLDGTERCDPIEFVVGAPTDCADGTVGGAVIFEDDFQAYSDTSDMVAAGYTIQNINGGSTEFFLGNFSGNNYAQVSGFSTGEGDIDTWLVTPSVDLSNTANDELLVDIEAAFDNGTILTVLYSTDFSGNVLEATWSELTDADIPVGPSSGFGGFDAAGPINTSCIDGTVNFAFRYQGSDPSATTRYHVDNIQVNGN